MLNQLVASSLRRPGIVILAALAVLAWGGYCLRELRIEAFEQGEHAMSEDNAEGLVKDAPIELCVELARFTVRLDDVLGVRAGEVWRTGRAIGEPW